MNWKTLTLTVAALLTLPTSINAAELKQIDQNQDWGIEMRNPTTIARRGKKGDLGAKMERLLQQLDLTAEQSQQIETIKERSRTAMEGLREQLQAQRQEMRSLLASEATTEEIRARHQETQNLHQQLGNNRFATMLEIREILTLEQRAEMAELIDSRRDRKPEGR
ncbi:MAG: Spy/CpxP family protein refolding chaperone [Cyanobacteria bacterium J06623_7]